MYDAKHHNWLKIYFPFKLISNFVSRQIIQPALVSLELGILLLWPNLMLQNAPPQGLWAFSNKLIYRKLIYATPRFTAAKWPTPRTLGIFQQGKIQKSICLEMSGEDMPCPGLLLQNAVYQRHWAFSNKLIYRSNSVPKADVQRESR
jgi:hypothetical protein